MKGGIALLVFVPSLAFGCINDRDTLKFEQQNVDALNRIQKEPDSKKRQQAVKDLVLRAIAGRFERYPNQYYEMRIKRLEAKTSLTAMEYDDLAVAYDRVGGVDFALAIAEKSLPLRKSNEDKYRYYANHGTFLVHKWVANGAKGEDKALLKQSIKEIETALKINPNSHFGREKVQLALEKSWLDPESEYENFQGIEPEGIMVGAAGIIMMGLGYELPDVYGLLGTYQHHPGIIEDASWIRMNELVQKEKPALLTFSVPSSVPISDEYKQLRSNGQEAHRARMSYMTSRFDKGEHPDTHPAFWDGWKEPEYPTSFAVNKSLENTNKAYNLFIGAVAVAVVAAFGVGYVVSRRRRHS